MDIQLDHKKFKAIHTLVCRYCIDDEDSETLRIFSSTNKDLINNLLNTSYDYDGYFDDIFGREFKTVAKFYKTILKRYGVLNGMSILHKIFRILKDVYKLSVTETYIMLIFLLDINKYTDISRISEPSIEDVSFSVESYMCLDYE